MQLSLQELFQKATSGEVKLYSELGSRDEGKQTYQRPTRISKLATKCGHNLRILAMKDIVLPFNPFSGAPDEIYNSKTPFRPILLVSQAIQMIKLACANDTELASKYETILGGKFSDGDVTFEDYLLFKKNKFIQKRVMSYNTVSVDVKGREGLPEFKVKYTVPWEDNTAETAPFYKQLTFLFYAILSKEWAEQEAQLKASGANGEAIQKAKSAVFAKSPIRYASSTNILPFFAFPLNEDLPVLSKDDLSAVEKHMFFYSKTDKFDSAFTEVDEDMEQMADYLIDFYDFHLTTPKSGKPKDKGGVYADDDPNAIYQAMGVKVTDSRYALKAETFREISNVIAEYFKHSQEEQFREDGMSFERLLAISSRFKPMDSKLDSIVVACRTIFNESFATSKYFTEEVKKANAKTLLALDPNNALTVAAFDDDEVDAAHAQQVVDLAKTLETETDDIAVDLA